ncbi:hypothetical protein J7T55_007640 [Diaporthe amygdali]|uniref:uncharacterized protein n=1 Tax=Phomopsis amygdali TaxID=1214568 RepID=UPI0022FF0014|nr:uncharacterized protein J7T55_007640 [Diaporthe amygdali]KAJ0107451.1 hypothetical protein J7T55_007640 [Diaporthe amygdali]
MNIVESASAEELRAVVLALCKDTAVTSQIVGHIKKLRAAKAYAPKPGEKRKASDQAFICVRCGETFSEKANNSKACTYHYGKWEMEVCDDEENDFWADHDEDCHGLIDTKEMREEYPEGFTWDCCYQVGTAPGCTKGHYYAIKGKRMKINTDEGSVLHENSN